MILSRYITKISAVPAALAASALLWGCAADDFDPVHDPSAGYDADTQLVLRLAVPQGETPVTRSVPSAPTKQELAINALHILIFPASGGEAVVNRPLMIPSEMAVDPDKGTVTYEFGGFTAGKGYKIFVLGNIPHDDLYAISTEEALRKYIMDYTAELPEAGNLPMVYEETGKSTFEIDENPTAPEVKSLSMKYACVKMKLNLIFDRDHTTSEGQTVDALYGVNGFKPTTLKLNHVSGKAPLVIYDNKDAVEGDRTLDLLGSGAYYTSWTETPDNDKTGDDIITLGEEATGTFTGYADNWLWQQTLYLPERYTATEGGQMEFELEGTLTAATGEELNATVKFEAVAVGVEDKADNVAATDLPRGSYYEFIGKIASKEVEGNRLNATVTLKKWEEVTLPVDFIHTYLTLDKTTASVESLKSDYLVYSTDGEGGVTFECETKLQDKSILIGTPKYNPQYGYYIELTVNPSVDVTLLSAAEAEGTATCWVVAGNIRKKVEVDYNITPFFEITPTERTIAYQDGADNVTYFTYRTNLGGIKLTAADGNTVAVGPGASNGYVSTSGKSELSVSLDGGISYTSPTGELKMEATTKPETTSVHTFYAQPVKTPSASTYSFAPQLITVTVQPPLENYRIYFRAINDYSVQNSDDGTTRSYEFLAARNYTLPKEGVEDWIDFWNNENSESTGYFHNVYIYNQYGNNTDFGKNDMPVATFTGGYEAYVEMSKDNTNTGWYYYDLGKNAEPKDYYNDGKTKLPEEYKKPRPGETLIIFYNHEKGNTIHRLAHVMEPGVPLYSCADGESWTLYDPTRSPRFTSYDDKPIVEDVDYTIYSDVPVTGWYNDYGKWEYSNNYYSIRIWSNHVNTTTETIGGKQYYKTVIPLKAVRGEYDKAINIKFEGESLNTEFTPNPNAQYIWYCNNHSGSYQFTIPYIYFSGGTWPGYKMTYSHKDNGADYYYYMVPSSQTANFILNNNAGTQYPGNNQGWLEAGKVSRIYYSDNISAGTETSILPQQGGGSSYSGESQLFDGDNWTVGTFNSQTGVWSQGAPN